MARILGMFKETYRKPGKKGLPMQNK